VVSTAHAWPSAHPVTVVSVLCAPDPDSHVSAPLPRLELDFGGVVGDRHHGLTRPSDTRQLRYYPRGTLIRNRRQVSVVAVDELAEIAEQLGLPYVEAGWLGANLLVDGVPALSALPIGSRLLFAGGAGLVCEGVNQPCRLPAEVIQAHFPRSRAQAGFVKAAYGRRGIVASVELPAPVAAGEAFTVALPELHSPPGLRLAHPRRTGRAQG
jgi:hypothetical protein